MVRTIFLIVMILINYLVSRGIPAKNKNNVFLNISFLELFLILLFRAPFSDMINYINMFHRIAELPFSELGSVGWEYGYVIFNKIIAIISSNDRVLIGIISFITLFGQYIFIKKYSNNYLITVILFIGLNFFNYNYILLRQEIALVIILFSIRYIEEKKFIKFLLCIIIAILFHQSALVFIIVYILSKIKCTNKIKIYCIPIFIIIFIFRNFLGRLLYINTYVEYVGNTQTTEGYTMLAVLLLIYIAMLFVEFVIIKNGKSKNEVNNTENIFYWMYIVAIAFQILATTQSLVSRIVLYFNFSLIILLPRIIEKIENKKILLLVNFILIISIIGFSCTNQPDVLYEVYMK